MYAYGYCVVQEDPRRARRVLSLAPGSAAERELLTGISTQLCVEGTMAVQHLTFDPQLLRGVIAEALLDRAARSRRSEWVAPFTGLTAADIEALDERGRRALRALDFAQCVFAAAPDAVSGLLATLHASRAETRSFERLEPHLGPCLASGAQMTISRPQFRGFLAEAAYRAAYAAALASR